MCIMLICNLRWSETAVMMGFEPVTVWIFTITCHPPPIKHHHVYYPYYLRKVCGSLADAAGWLMVNYMPTLAGG